MPDKLFVQFSNIRNAKRHTSYTFSNGFSEAFSLCKNLGDFYWSDSPQYLESGIMDQEPNIPCPPLNKGNIYASCFNVVNTYIVYKWAIEKPNVNFLVGGPSVQNLRYDKKQIPKNLKFTTKTVEQYFKVPNFSQQWGLEIPEIPKEWEIMFSYVTENRCYNNKCIFCSHYKTDERTKHNPKYEFQGMFPGRNKIIFITTPSASPKFLKEELQKMPSGNEYLYLIFIRPDQIIGNILENILIEWEKRGRQPNIRLMIGIDFLSNKMLQYIRKNHTIEDAIKVLKILEKYNVDTIISTIMGWPVLTEQDLINMNKYLQEEPVLRSTNFQWLMNELQAKVNSDIHNDPLYKGTKQYIGPFYIGFTPELTKEKEDLNEEARQLFRDNLIKDLYVDRKGKSIRQPYNY
jgi:hypothetical protein